MRTFSTLTGSEWLLFFSSLLLWIFVIGLSSQDEMPFDAFLKQKNGWSFHLRLFLSSTEWWRVPLCFLFWDSFWPVRKKKLLNCKLQPATEVLLFSFYSRSSCNSSVHSHFFAINRMPLCFFLRLHQLLGQCRILSLEVRFLERYFLIWNFELPFWTSKNFSKRSFFSKCW